MANDIKLQEGHPVDQHLRPVKVGGELTGIELSDTKVRTKDIEVDNIRVNGNYSGTSPNDATKLPLAGGTMTGSIDMDGSSVTNIRNCAFDAGGSANEIKDEDNMVSNSSAVLATQQSIKAYVDSMAIFTQTYVHVYYQSNTTSSYIPWGGSTRIGTDDESSSYNDDIIFIAPYDGKITNTWLRNDYSSSAVPGYVSVYLSVNGTDGSQMNAGIVSWAYQTPLDYSCTANNTFSAGDILAVKVNPTVAPRYVTVTTVWEFTK